MKFYLCVFPFLYFAFSCSNSPHRAPISDLNVAPKKSIDYHIVTPGETLYSIAMKYDLDYKKLSIINNLPRDYAIVPGQKLSLKVDKFEPEKVPHIEPENSLQDVAKALVDAAEQVVNGFKKQTVSSVKKPKQSGYSAKIKWQWPISGKVLIPFSGNGGMNKGIDLQGKLGESIYAAAEGEVIYAGSGLRDYGNLLILKHGENFLSAYAHCRVLNVEEGDKVKDGSKIAEIGHSGSTQVAKLHFEIRVRGKPVDPLKYLPVR